MKYWIKTCCALVPPSVVRLIHKSATVILIIILLGSTALSQDSKKLGVSANEQVLFFTTISVQQTDNHSDFRRVPDDLTLTAEAGILNRQIMVADNR